MGNLKGATMESDWTRIIFLTPWQLNPNNSKMHWRYWVQTRNFS
uniref:Uncharacterized protein n=1 Tax=Arundo donax TaxID=35708 RepID=A0A0A9G7S2_ARUDO